MIGTSGGFVSRMYGMVVSVTWTVKVVPSVLVDLLVAKLVVVLLVPILAVEVDPGPELPIMAVVLVIKVFGTLS